MAAVLLVGVLGAACSGGGSPSDGRSEAASARVVSQNILHGIACPAETDRCRLPERVELFATQVAAGGCPELVALQEANQGVVDLLERSLQGRCGGRYRMVWDGDPGVDREVVATTLPVLASRRIRLAGPLRSALWVRVAAPVGALEVVTTHLASSSDDRPCDAHTCPPPCRPADSLNTCQARQVVAFAASVRVPGDVVVLGGDLNARPGEPTIEVLRRAGYVDTHVAAGNAECAPARRAPGAVAFPSDHTGVQATITCATTPDQHRAARSATTQAPSPTTVPGPTAVPATEAAAITAAFETFFNGDVTDVEAKLAALEDGARLRQFFLERYRATSEVAARVRVRIDAIRLEGSDRAAVTYSLLLGGAAVLDHLPGEAVKR